MSVFTVMRLKADRTASIEQQANERGWCNLCQILSHCLDHTTTPDPQANWDANSSVQQYPQWRWSCCSKLIACTCSYRPDANEWTYSIAAKCTKHNWNVLVNFRLLLCQRCIHHTANTVSSLLGVIWFIPNTRLARGTTTHYIFVHKEWTAEIAHKVTKITLN